MSSTLETLRKPKILGMSFFDWAVSLAIAGLIGVFVLRLPPPTQGIASVAVWVVWFFLWTVFGVLVHLAFGIHTMLGYYLGLNPMPERGPEKSL